MQSEETDPVSVAGARRRGDRALVSGAVVATRLSSRVARMSGLLWPQSPLSDRGTNLHQCSAGSGSRWYFH